MPTPTTSQRPESDLYTPLSGVPLTAGQLPRGAAPLTLLVVALAALGLWQFADWSAAACAVLGALVYTLLIYVWSRAVEGSRKATDRFVTAVVTCAFLLALLPLISVVFTVLSHGLARFDTEFFSYSMRGVVGEGGGAYHAIMGTLIITALATLISVPVGMLSAIYLVEYGRGRLAKAITFFVDVMTGIPSIVAGLFAYALFALIFGPGVRMGIMGAVALSVLMIPVVVRSTEEMLKLVPNELREASYALAVPKWRTITKVVLPTALAGIATGVTLAIARVIGETAPLLITVGITSSDNFNPFDGRMATLSVFSYYEYVNPGVPPQFSLDRAWAAALTLIIIVMVLNLIARLISRLFAPKTRG
ncbi:phosphate ABC transporter permease PtsA [Prauserella sp. PE36]|uniref:Phosphate transport system permease protein PstA n=1 Tax=Prauserella endophytica TaxID=1592324 RepID=A0ABY2SBL0_9PSEU|nr:MULTISPECIES: phosphate ABC transporter permease PstA [Prauserella]PXY34516.1 phosphate ABC transporter, permease protein PstA [Prauserella coralliicola]RBM13026.1 phosphate ABC transporter permease PtsA [Prauserella sp. PE36]TKG73053.1 phosphate ABC transporter permease PstA [Prauserella endophytica]